MPLQFIPRHIEFWDEFFTRFLVVKPKADQPDLTKAAMIKHRRSQNDALVSQILDNLREVNDLRRAKNELVFSTQFIMEHLKLVSLLKTITGMTDEEIDAKTNGKGLAMQLPASPFRPQGRRSESSANSDEETKDS